ncbi:fibronectin [Bacillus sp. FJAT-18017]|uniref:OmpL47-type beta-barrel domain-containing protein n=1 Tax=Bacillus sp. FJAT-18017 TaxID=1705566 RepID=UPI0006AF0D3D|nr:fibronectin [Bacillus sp. FJAT-18017]ALC89019.1 fibronectin [Bacillus sp. FJAT-18017]
MKKKWFSIQFFVAALLLLYHFTLPLGAVLAAENSSMLPPANLAYQTITPDDGKLTWNSVYGATGYKVYEIKDGQLTLLGSTTAISYSLNDLSEGFYRYVVSTLTSEGESGPSAPVSVEIIYPQMQAPSSLSSTIRNGNDIVLNWGASQYAQKYNIYQIFDSGERTLLTSTTGTTYTKVDAPEGIFTYSVSAVHSLYGESADTSPIKAEVTYPVMSQPSSLSFTITNGTDVNLKWQAAAYATSYRIYQDVDGQLELKKTVTGTNGTLTNLPPGEHIFKVYSFSDRFGESSEGTQVAVTVGSIVMTPPNNATYKIQNINDVVLTWGAVPYATRYNIYELKDGEKTLKSTTSSTTITYPMLKGGNYQYEIYSFSDRFGESEIGSEVSFSIDTVTMSAPKDVTYKIHNGNDIVLNWSIAEYATNYKVYQLIDGKKVLKTTVSSPTATFINAPAGENQYEIYSFSSRFGESAEGTSTIVSVVYPKMVPPVSVTGTTINPTALTLNWSSVDYATSYKVYEIVNGQKILKNTVTSTTVSYNNMGPGTYKYEVYAYSTRFGESQQGSPAEVTLSGQALPAPGNPTYSIANGNDLTLRWSSVQYATGYKIYQMIDGEPVFIRSVTGTSTTLINQPEGEFTFVVKAYSTLLGESPNGADINGAIVFPVMLKPLNFVYSISNGNDITLRWNTVSYANSYKIYRIVDGERVLERTVNGTSSVFANMPEGVYQYVVHSYSDRFGESPEASTLQFNLILPIMQAPSNLAKTISNGNDIVLSWNSSAYAKEYRVYKIIEGDKVLVKTVTGTSVSFTNMPEGDYQYVVHSYSDRFGESPVGSALEFNFTWPIMQAPANLAKTIPNGNDIALSWNSSTYAKEYKVYQIVDGDKVLIKETTGKSVSFTNMPEGDYQYIVHSYSDRFGESPVGSPLEFNLTWPMMQAPANLAKTIQNGNDITLTWKPSAFTKEYKIYQIENGEKILKRTITGTSTSFTNMPEGDYQYVVHSYSDRFGESPVGSPLDFNLTWPIMQAPTANGSVFNVNNITLAWKAVSFATEYRVYKADGDSKELIYKGTQLSSSIYNLAEDTHSFEVTAYSSRFGESAPSSRVDQTIIYPIMESPTASLRLLSQTSARISWDFVTYANGYNIYEIIDGKPVLLVKNVNNLSYDIQNLSYANHEYYVTSYSNSFGESKPSATVLAKLIIDTEAPETKINAPSQWVNQNQLLTLQATDNETGVANTLYSINDGPIQKGTSILIDQEGINKIQFNSIDKVGNLEEVKTVFVKVDKSAPVTEINTIPVYAQSFTAQLTRNDSLSGAEKTYYSINDSEFAEGTSFTVEKEGMNKISYYSVDAAGNMEEIKTKEVNIDKTSPVTSANVPDTWVNEDVTVTLTTEDELSGAVKTYYSINGSEYTEGTSFTVEEEGINEISYYSVDAAGNKEDAITKQVKIDKTTPATASDVPEVWINEDVTVTLTTEDELSGAVKTYYSINGSEYTEGTSFTVEEEGINEISYYSVDAAGNKEDAITKQIKIDKTTPVTASDVPEAWVNEDVTVTLTTEDELSGAVKTYYSINGSEYTKGTSFTVEQEGINEISYYSVDAVGNTEEVKTKAIKIDKTVPTVSVLLDGEYQLGTSFTLDYDAYDYQSRIAQEVVTLNGQTYKYGDVITLDQPGEYKLKVQVTDGSGLSTVVEKTFTVYIGVELEVLPKVIKGNKGIFTVKASLPKTYQSSSFNVLSVTLNGVSAVADNKGLEKQAEKGHFKFNREEFDWVTGQVNLTFRGYLNNGFLVIGNTNVEVKK